LFVKTKKDLGSFARVHSVNDFLLLAIKSLYSCWEVCVLSSNVKSQSFTVCVGLRQGLCYQHWYGFHCWKLHVQLFSECLLKDYHCMHLLNRIFKCT